MSAVGIIPARFAATRFPGKPLAPIAGLPMVQRVWQGAREAKRLREVIVATEDARVADACRAFGAEVTLTSPDHPTGTDRIAEVAARLPDRIVVNVQGDEPLIDPPLIDACAALLAARPDCVMSTAAHALESVADYANPNVVKVVADLRGRAIYFSRLPVPYVREGSPDPVRFKHIGLYVYRRDLLLGYSDLPVGPLEQAERLEQLRALENGHSIRVVETEYDSLGVDTPDDLKRVSQLFEASLFFHG